MIAKLYRKCVSPEIRYTVYDAFLSRVLSFGRHPGESLKSLFIYIFQCFLPKTSENTLYAFMGKHGLTFYPYKFMLEYKLSSIDCIYDHQQAMYYIVHKGKKLYFPEGNEVNNIRVMYRMLIIEQDIRSPHRYLNDLSRLAGKTVLDIGAAEGIFALEVVELVKHLYLFECDEHWLKALNATFAPWKEKVTIVEKYVSAVDDELNITIDRFLEGKDKRNLFLKMDIEGYEQAALKGAKNTLKEVHDLDYAICTYHRADDAEAIGRIFSDNHFESEFTDGFLYFAEYKSFRRAMIRRKI